jgi:hypothetical protein
MLRAGVSFAAVMKLLGQTLSQHRLVRSLAGVGAVYD